jgi:hypothetical protein
VEIYVYNSNDNIVKCLHAEEGHKNERRHANRAQELDNIFTLFIDLTIFYTNRCNYDFSTVISYEIINLKILVHNVILLC